MSFKIGFKLTELDELLDDWQKPKQLSQIVYLLSWGRYWFEIDDDKLPTSHPACRGKYQNRSVEIDGSVLRLLDHVQDILPKILAPVHLIIRIPVK